MHCHHSLSVKAVKHFFEAYPLIIPSFIAFALAPRSGLRSFIGVQALPSPVAVDESIKRRFSRAAKISAIAFILSVIGLEYYALTADIETGTLERFITIAVGLTVNTSLIMFATTMTRSLRWSVYRHSTGIAIWSAAPGSIKYWKLIPVIMASTYLNVQSYLTTSRALTFVTSLAIIYRFVAQPPRRVHSVRKVILGLTSTIFFVVIFTVVLTAIAIRASPSGETDGEPSQEPYPFSPQFRSYFNTFLTALVSAAPGSLIAVCYRFDYTQHQKRSDENQPLLAIESIPSKGLHYTTGVLIPLRAPRKFARPFYATTLISWLASYIAIAVVFKTHPALRELRHVESAFDVVALLITLPVMIGSLLLVARCRGELTDLWTSKEDWLVPMVEEEKVDDGESGDEAVPAYSDVVKEDTSPAYVEDMIKV